MPNLKLNLTKEQMKAAAFGTVLTALVPKTPSLQMSTDACVALAASVRTLLSHNDASFHETVEDMSDEQVGEFNSCIDVLFNAFMADEPIQAVRALGLDSTADSMQVYFDEIGQPVAADTTPSGQADPAPVLMSSVPPKVDVFSLTRDQVLEAFFYTVLLLHSADHNVVEAHHDSPPRRSMAVFNACSALLSVMADIVGAPNKDEIVSDKVQSMLSLADTRLQRIYMEHTGGH
jgi:hypothetical protein